jgi:hypothetical protein
VTASPSTVATWSELPQAASTTASASTGTNAVRLVRRLRRDKKLGNPPPSKEFSGLHIRIRLPMLPGRVRYGLFLVLSGSVGGGHMATRKSSR